MLIWVLDKELSNVRLIDDFKSLLWIERYYEAGEFELYVNATAENVRTILQGYYLWVEESDQTMIVEQIKTETDVETGNMLVITGRSLESLLDRRIVWEQTRIRGNFQNGMKKLLTENVISPSIQDRKMTRFRFKESDDPAITELMVDSQYTGDNLYELTVEACKKRKIGFRVMLTSDNLFEFSFYVGSDRTYDQTDHPYVIFSPNFDNIVSSTYIDSSLNYKNVTLVLGEDEGESRRYRIVGSASDLDRRELYTDARDIQSEQGPDEPPLTNEEYYALLDARGAEKLLDWPYVKTFDGQVDTNQSFTYGEDFFKGDLVQVVTGLGEEAISRIVEVIHSEDASGYILNPIFEIEEGGETNS